MTAKMKAVLFDEFGKPDVLQIREIDVPVPKPDEVLVKVAAAAVNPKDCMVRSGKFKLMTGQKFPMGVGYDLSGTVMDIGSDVCGFKAGDKVYGMINGWAGGAYAEYAVIKKSEMAIAPDNISLHDAAAVPLAAQTALQSLRDLGCLEKVPGKPKVLINGASGGVGTFAVQIAKAMGAEVTAVCSSGNHAMVKQLGADILVDYRQNPDLNQSSTYHVFFDVFGNRKFGKIRDLLDDHGTYITTVPKPISFLQHFISPLFKKRSKLVVVKSKRQDLEWLGGEIMAKKIRPVIDRSYDLSDASSAHEYIQSKRAKGKVLLICDSES